MTGILIKLTKMVRLKIKLADNSSESKKWICKRIDDEPVSEHMNKKYRGTKESLPINIENIDEESEDFGNWYESISSFLEIEMKEAEEQQPSCGSSSENITNSSQTYAIPSHGIAGRSNNSCNDALDLSAKSSKSASQTYAIPSHGTMGRSNNSCNDALDLSAKSSKPEYKSDINTLDPKSKYLESMYVDSCNTSTATKGTKILRKETAYHIPMAMPSRLTYPISNQKPIDSREIMAMSRRITPSINQNFPMGIDRSFPVSSGFVNSEKPAIATQNIFLDSQEQKTPRTLVTNYRHFSADAAKYGHSSNQYHSELNRCYSWPQGIQGKDNSVPIGNEFTERTGDISLNNQAQNYVSHHKRPLTNSVQIGSKDFEQPSYPPNKKKSQDRALHYCKLCDSTFKSSNGYTKHLKSERHLRISNQVNPQKSTLNNFQPNPVIRPPMNIPAQLPPLPLLHLVRNPMWYYHYPANAVSAANQSEHDRTRINNTDEQNPNPGIPMSGRSLGHTGSQIESYAPNMRYMLLPVNPINNPPNTNLETTKILDDTRSQNDLRIDYYTQNPIFVNLTTSPTSHTSHSSDAQSNNLLMIDPNYLENLKKKGPESDCTLKNPSPETQSENSTAACSFGKSEDAQPVSQYQKSFYLIYHCMVCSVFHTDFFQELEKHVSHNRRETPFEMVTMSEDYSLCKLCNFKTQISMEMALHCDSKSHMDRVEYYNHVIESGIRKNEKLIDFENFSAVSLFCSACEFSAKSIIAMRVHSADRRHHHNVSCYWYAAGFKETVEYCYCRACKVKTHTKSELLTHVRSENHWIKLQDYPLEDSPFKDPKNLLFFKDLKENEPPGILEQSETSTEMPYLANINTDNRKNAENSRVDSASSTSQQPLPISCLLCQQIFQELNVLVDHVQRIHKVNEAGIKWFYSTIIQKNMHKLEGTVSQEELTKTDKQKSIVFSPQISSTDEKLPSKGETVASFSDRTYVAIEETAESESPASRLGVGISGKIVATDQNQGINADSPSKQQPCETKCTWDSDKLYQNPHANPHIETSIDFSNQQLINKECMRNSEKSDEILDFDKMRRINVEFLSEQQICNTGNMLPVGEERVNPDEELNSCSSPAENELQVNVDNKLEIKTDYSLKESFSTIEHGLPTSQSNLNQNCKRKDSLSCDPNSVTHERLPTFEGSSTEHTSPFSQSHLNSNRGKNDYFISDHNGSSISHSILNTSTESYDSSSSHGSSVGYKQPSEKAKQISSTEKNMVNLTSNQNYLLDSQESRWTLEEERSHHLRRNKENNSSLNRLIICESNQECLFDSQNRKVDTDSQTSSLGALVEPKLKAKSSNLITTERCEMESRDFHTNYYNSDAAINVQMQAEKNIQNLEILDVFSLADCVDYNHDSDDDEDDDEEDDDDEDDDDDEFDFENVVFPDLEET